MVYKSAKTASEIESEEYKLMGTITTRVLISTKEELIRGPKNSSLSIGAMIDKHLQSIYDDPNADAEIHSITIDFQSPKD